MTRHSMVLITLLWCLFFNCGCTSSLAKYEPFSLYIGQDVRLLKELNVWAKGSAFNKNYQLVTSLARMGSQNFVGVLPAGDVLEIVDVRRRDYLIGSPGFIAVLQFDRPQGKGQIVAEYHWGSLGSLRKPPWQLVDTTIADPFMGLQDDDELYVGIEGKSYKADGEEVMFSR